MGIAGDMINEFNIEKFIESKEYWEELAKCKEDFIKKGIDPRNNPIVRKEVAEAWVTAKSYGIKVDRSYEPYILDDYSLHEVRNKNKLLINTARPLIEGYERMAISSGFSLEMLDSSGCCILGTHIPLPQSAGRDILGVRWDYKKTGIFAHHLAMKYKKPFFLIGPEVYLDKFKNVIGFAAPILDENTTSIGALVLWRNLGEEPWTDAAVKFPIHTMGWVTTLAMAIEKQIHLAKSNRLTMTTLELIDEAIVTVNKAGNILSANSKANRLFNISEKSNSISILDYFSESSIIANDLQNGRKKESQEEILTINNKKEIYFVSINPVIENNDYDLDLAVLRFVPQHKITSMIAKNIGSNANFTFDDIIGKSRPVLDVKKLAKRFADSMENILLLGESGTGKELFAQAIHNQSCPSGSFIALNCSVMPRNIIESELFGYESGTFTGGEKNGKPGKIELANGGTLFLDEIGEIPFELQAILLRVLQDKKVVRLGGQYYRKVNFRLIAGTNQDLRSMLATKNFREDLYFRLSVLNLKIPPLRVRENDVIVLAEYFIKNYAQKMDRPVPTLSSKTIDKLLTYNWPGNVRQLENSMIYAMNICDTNTIDVNNLPEDIILDMNTSENNINSSRSIKDLEERVLLDTYKQTHSVAETAKILGVSKTTVYRKLKTLIHR